jgi:hypothetical protein
VGVALHAGDLTGIASRGVMLECQVR